MNYSKIYTSLVNRAIPRKKMKKGAHDYVYYEKHHIIPKCLGGSDGKENLVYLTAEEHWLAHLLLVKMNPGNPKLVYACQAMSMTGSNNPGRITNKMFGWIRREYSATTSKAQKGKVIGPETRKKISDALKGRPALHQQGDLNVSKRPEVAKKISEANTGKIMNFSDPIQRGRKISESKKGRPNLPGELNPAFKGWITATPINGGPLIKMSSLADMRSNGFTPACVYRCVWGVAKQHKGYTFRRDPLPKNVDSLSTSV